jgi:hypothetical protein
MKIGTTLCAFVDTESLKHGLELCIVYGSCFGGARGDAVGWGTALQVRKVAVSIPDGVTGFFSLI